MQQILNSQERNQAFVKFLVFFLLTVILVVTAVFFNYRLPVRENKMLQDEVDVQRQQEANQQKFVNRMQEAIVLLDSLDANNTNLEQINLQLNGKIAELAVLQQKDNTLYGKLNKVIVDRFQELQQKQRQLESLSDKAGKLASLQSELEKCKSDLAVANAALDGFRKGSPN